MSTFKRICREAEAEIRHHAKDTEPAEEIIYRRAKERARRSGVPISFVWDDPAGLGYFALVPYFEAARQPGARCLNCLHPFDNDPGTQLEHRIPPDNERDWPRLHVRNIWIACKRCNGIKHRKDLYAWLDSEWEHQQLAVGERKAEIANDPFAATLQPGMLL